MKSYKIVMMNRHEIRIDAEELPKVIKAISAGSPAILKQAIFNPSSYSHIVEDNSRLVKEQLTDELGHYIEKYKMHYEEIPDIFEGIKEITELKSADVKRIANELRNENSN